MRLIHDKQGEPEEIVGSWSDITARKAAEEAVAATRAHVEQLLASSPAVIYSFKASGDFRPTFVSQNIKDWLGYEQRDYLDSPDFWRSCAPTPTTWRGLRASSANYSSRAAIRLNIASSKKDGSYCWVSDELRLIHDKQGEPEEIVGSWSDITARKQLAEALVAERLAQHREPAATRLQRRADGR